MNHRTYDGQRFSPLSRINRDSVKNLKLAFAVPLGGISVDFEGTPWLRVEPAFERQAPLRNIFGRDGNIARRPRRNALSGILLHAKLDGAPAPQPRRNRPR
jgi:hypothetical protein